MARSSVGSKALRNTPEPPQGGPLCAVFGAGWGPWCCQSGRRGRRRQGPAFTAVSQAGGKAPLGAPHTSRPRGDTVSPAHSCLLCSDSSCNKHLGRFVEGLVLFWVFCLLSAVGVYFVFFFFFWFLKCWFSTWEQTCDVLSLDSDVFIALVTLWGPSAQGFPEPARRCLTHAGFLG